MLAFLSVIIFTALVSIVATTTITRSRFQRYSLASDTAQSESLAPVLGRFYRQANGWQSIESSLISDASAMDSMMSHMSSGTMMTGMMGADSDPFLMWMPPASRIVVADTRGRIVADTELALTGETYDAGRLRNGTPIEIDRTRVGTVFVGSMVAFSLSPLELDFIRSVGVATVGVVAVAMVLAFFFSSAFSSRVTEPIRAVMVAAEKIADGNLSTRVTLERGDEIGKLAHSFNTMGMSLEEGERQRKQLIADIAHELRTPLSLIRGDLEAVLDAVYPLSLDTVASVHKETLFLGKLIDDLRELSLLDADQLRLEMEKTAPRDLAVRAAGAFGNEAKRRGIILTTEVGTTPHLVDVDRDRIHQVLCNLVSNALRYTPDKGGIAVGVASAAKTGEPESVQLYVEDSGPGIDLSEQERIFDRFYRPDTSRTRATGGSGLGLAISRKIVEAHGGSIQVESTGKTGSRFTIRLPAAREGA